MLENISVSKILFLDVETVPLVYKYTDLDETKRKLWDTKFRYQQTESQEIQYQKAGVYAEFAKVVCISVGFFSDKTFRIKSYSGGDEKQLLMDFSTLLNEHFNRKDHLLCAHNGKEFDFPFLCRRMLINGLKLP